MENVDPEMLREFLSSPQAAEYLKSQMGAGQLLSSDIMNNVFKWGRIALSVLIGLFILQILFSVINFSLIVSGSSTGSPSYIYGIIGLIVCVILFALFAVTAYYVWTVQVETLPKLFERIQDRVIRMLQRNR